MIGPLASLKWYTAFSKVAHEAVKVTGDMRVMPGQRMRILCLHREAGYMDIVEFVGPYQKSSDSTLLCVLSELFRGAFMV